MRFSHGATGQVLLEPLESCHIVVPIKTIVGTISHHHGVQVSKPPIRHVRPRGALREAAACQALHDLRFQPLLIHHRRPEGGTGALERLFCGWPQKGAIVEHVVDVAIYGVARPGEPHKDNKVVPVMPVGLDKLPFGLTHIRLFLQSIDHPIDALQFGLTHIQLSLQSIDPPNDSKRHHGDHDVEHNRLPFHGRMRSFLKLKVPCL
mmetsp:Transcript_39500/g.91222  ORF Transcript_39500/g.91222 Transcript_39500/m.91222 type:complete len:206 (-) Transcript_39500:62-679(-)